MVRAVRAPRPAKKCHTALCTKILIAMRQSALLPLLLVILAVTAVSSEGSESEAAEKAENPKEEAPVDDVLDEKLLAQIKEKCKGGKLV